MGGPPHHAHSGQVHLDVLRRRRPARPPSSTRRSLRVMKPGDLTVALLLSIALTGCMGGLPPKPPVIPSTSTTDEIRALVELVNRHRRGVGCKDLIWLEPVASVAQKHSDDMVRRGFFDHKNPDGLTPFQRLNAAGLKFTRAAENIAAGQATAHAVMASWLS